MSPWKSSSASGAASIILIKCNKKKKKEKEKKRNKERKRKRLCMNAAFRHSLFINIRVLPSVSSIPDAVHSGLQIQL